MKKFRTHLIATLITCLALTAVAQKDLKNDPAYLPIDDAIDLNVVTPEVNVNLPRFLLNNIVSEFDGGDDDPFAQAGIPVQDLLKDIKLIRVMVIEGDNKSRPHLDRAYEKLSHRLKNSWTPSVSVPEDNIGIYAVSDASGDQMAGLSLLIHDGDDLIVGNIVGNLPIGKILKLAQSFAGDNGDKLKEIIGQFAAAGMAEDKPKK